jgi:hypothetical protein
LVAGGVAVSVGVLVTVGVLVGVNVWVLVGVFVGVFVCVGVFVAGGVLVTVGVLVFVGVSVAVGVSDGVGLMVGVFVCVGVLVGGGVFVIVGVFVTVGVLVGVLVMTGVFVLVAVGVFVCVGVFVRVGVAEGAGGPHWIWTVSATPELCCLTLISAESVPKYTAPNGASGAAVSVMVCRPATLGQDELICTSVPSEAASMAFSGGWTPEPAAWRNSPSGPTEARQIAGGPPFTVTGISSGPDAAAHAFAVRIMPPGRISAAYPEMGTLGRGFGTTLVVNDWPRLAWQSVGLVGELQVKPVIWKAIPGPGPAASVSNRCQSMTAARANTPMAMNATVRRARGLA